MVVLFDNRLNQLQSGAFVLIKRGMLFVLISGVGTALAMAIPTHVPEDKMVSDASDAVEKTHPEFRGTNSEPDKRLSSEIILDLSSIKRTIPDSIQASRLFQSKSWYKAPPPPPSPSRQSISLTPPAPSAPPLPFIFIGRMIDGNEVTLFLEKNDKHYAVKVNDVVEGVYQVDAISDNDADLTYIPMKISQKLVFDSTLAGHQGSDSQPTIPIQSISILPANTAQPMAASVSRSVLNP